MMPVVSFIVPVYNGEAYIAGCLTSICTQSLSDIEVIVIDDGSTDSTANLVKEFAKNDQRIVYVYQDNQGQGVARNSAILRARGEYVFFVDADDLLAKDALAEIYDTACRTKADVTHFNWAFFSDNIADIEVISQEDFFTSSVLKDAECEELLQVENYFSTPNLYLRSFIIDANIGFGEGRVYEDYEFMIQVAQRATTVAIIDKPLYYYRKNNITSSTRNKTGKNRHAEDFITAIERSVEISNFRNPKTNYYLLRYFLNKLLVYYEGRIANNKRNWVIRQFIDNVRIIPLPQPLPSGNRFLLICIQLNVFQKKRYLLLKMLVIIKIAYSRLRLTISK